MYSTEILLNIARIRNVNLTEIDSNSTARETQDEAPLQRQAKNNQGNSHNFTKLNTQLNLLTVTQFPCHFKENRHKLALTMCKNR